MKLNFLFILLFLPFLVLSQNKNKLDRDNGLPDAKLGTDISSFKNLNSKFSTPYEKNYTYTRSDDPLTFAGKNVKSIQYTFIYDKLYEIDIKIKDEDVDYFLKYLKNRYGRSDNDGEVSATDLNSVTARMDGTNWKSDNVYLRVALSDDGREISISRNFTTPMLYEMQIESAIKRGKQEEATTYLYTAIKHYPLHPKFAYYDLYYNKKSFTRKENIKRYENVVNLLTDEMPVPQLHNILGDLYMHEGDIESGIKNYKKVLYLTNETDFTANFELGAHFYNLAYKAQKENNEELKRKYFLEALPYLENAFKENSTDKPLLKALATVYSNLGRTEDSKKMELLLAKPSN